MISISGSTYEVKRAKFKTFLSIQHYQEQIQEASDDPLKQGDLICECVGVALNIPKSSVLDEPWKNVAIAYVAISTENLLTFELAFMKTRSGVEEKLPWDYPGRDWYSFSHLMAKQYGWSLEYIADLEVEDALKLLQEIMVTEQLQREWEWDLSEKSIMYDPAAKKSKHIDLPRPVWMIVIPEPPKKVRIHRGLIPKGLVMKLDGTYAETS